jgi:stage II sporulation protein AA (anti-sigma F factor antagonist)
MPAFGVQRTKAPPIRTRKFELIPAPFEVETSDREGVRVLSVRGELDLNTAPELEAPLLQALEENEPAIVINLSDCEFIDSTGVALIVRAWQQLQHNSHASGRLVICCPNHQVRRLLDITGVQATIPLHEDLDSALAEARR